MTKDHVQESLLHNPGWRQQLLQLGCKFLNAPYFWGGCSAPFHREKQTGVDCSGLTHLLYRTCGIEIPRNAYDQYQALPSVTPQELQIADLVFMTSTAESPRLDHVMLYAGGDRLLEATLGVGKVHLTTFKEKFQFSLLELMKDLSLPSQKLSFATPVKESNIL